MAKPETLEMIAAAERRMRGVTNDERSRTGGVTARRGDDDDDFSDFVDDGEDRDTLNARPQRIEDIDTAKVYAKFNGRRTG